MKVAVLGAGVIGVSTAYYLSRAGHDVTVIERQLGPALETSFANAGEISPGYASPWAAPGIPAKALRWLFMEHAPLILRPDLSPAMFAWTLRMLRNCTSARYAVNKARMVRLAEYSRDCLIALRADTGIRYDERTQGTLQLFRTQAQLDGTAKDIEEVLRGDGVRTRCSMRTAVSARNPRWLTFANKIVGGLRLPNDETGDCFKFTSALAQLASAAGVRFDYGRTILRLRSQGSRIDSVDTSTGPLIADAYVLALGSFSPRYSTRPELSPTRISRSRDTR